MKFGFGFCPVLLEQIEQIVWLVEVLQGTTGICGAAKVSEPGTGLLGKLLDVRATIAREGEGDLEAAAFSVFPCVGATRFAPGGHMCGGIEPSSVSFGLGNALRDVDALALGLDYRNRYQAAEQNIVCLGVQVGHGPLGNCLVLALLGTCAFDVGEIQRVGLPARLIELLVDENAGEIFIQVELPGCSLGFLGELLGDLGLRGQVFAQGLKILLMLDPQIGQLLFLRIRLLFVVARLDFH